MFYPTIKDETVMVLNLVIQSLEKDPGYLDNPDCPFSDVVKTYFRKTGTAHPSIDIFAGEEELVVIDSQIQKIINDLEAFSKTLGQADHNEKLSYFKTKTTLLEKLIGMRERTATLKEINEFRATILGFMDEVCTKDQVTNLMTRLDGIFA